MTQYSSIDYLNDRFEAQQKAFQVSPYPSLQERKRYLQGIHQSLVKHQDAFYKAVSLDYGNRSSFDSAIADVVPNIAACRYYLKRLKKLMKPSCRWPDLLLMPSSVKVEYQPLGVVGIICPWNFPLMLSLGPLIAAVAAGNRALIKMPENTPHTNQVVRTLLQDVFTDDYVAVVEGGSAIGSAFSSLPFNHLFFTGSPRVGKLVMAEAAKNLTPVTLELGGKSPTFILNDIAIETAVARLFLGKTINGGQICVAPDYVLIHKDRVKALVDAYVEQFKSTYARVDGNEDYTACIDERQYQRIKAMLADAEQKGATIVSASGEGPNDDSRVIPTHLVTNVTDDMQIMQEEIFGPILAIKGYESLDEAIDYVVARPRPLALYILSFNQSLQRHILQRTHSGGVAINETAFHAVAEDAPFGGVGNSGMGHYHGVEGFRTFSHARTVLRKGRFNITHILFPPFNTVLHRLVLRLFAR